MAGPLDLRPEGVALGAETLNATRRPIRRSRRPVGAALLTAICLGLSHPAPASSKSPGVPPGSVRKTGTKVGKAAQPSPRLLRVGWAEIVRVEGGITPRPHPAVQIETLGNYEFLVTPTRAGRHVLIFGRVGGRPALLPIQVLPAVPARVDRAYLTGLLKTLSTPCRRSCVVRAVRPNRGRSGSLPWMGCAVRNVRCYRELLRATSARPVPRKQISLAFQRTVLQWHLRSLSKALTAAGFAKVSPHYSGAVLVLRGEIPPASLPRILGLVARLTIGNPPVRNLLVAGRRRGAAPPLRGGRGTGGGALPGPPIPLRR